MLIFCPDIVVKVISGAGFLVFKFKKRTARSPMMMIGIQKRFAEDKSDFIAN